MIIWKIGFTLDFEIISLNQHFGAPPPYCWWTFILFKYFNWEVKYPKGESSQYIYNSKIFHFD